MALNNNASYLPVISLLLLRVYTFCPLQGLPFHLRKLFYPLFLEELKKKEIDIKELCKMVKFRYMWYYRPILQMKELSNLTLCMHCMPTMSGIYIREDKLQNSTRCKDDLTNGTWAFVENVREQSYSV